jgi:hypothetical protein
MVDREVLAYENEKVAEADAEALGHALEQLGGEGVLATDGATAEVTDVIAIALSKMSETDDEQEKVAHIEEAVEEITKIASSPGNNNVVAGAHPGKVAKGESSAKSTDHKKELTNAVANTRDRPNVFSPTPGKSGVKGGTIGAEKAHPGAEGKSTPVKDHDKELSNAVPNTAHRRNYFGAPGKTGIKGGVIGTEKDAPKHEKQASLSDFLARL